MTTTYEIPLQPDASSFGVSLSGVDYQFTLQWREAGGAGWILDIADASGNRVVSGIPLVTGCDLFAQYRHLGFTGMLIVGTDGDPYAPPTFTNLGKQSHLFYVTEP